MSQEDIRLREYELCEQDNISVANHFWVVAGAFITVNTAAFGGLVYSTLAGSISLARGFWAVFFLSFAFGIILWHLRLYRRRVDFRISINYERARELELELGMWKNWRVFGVDGWQGKGFSNKIPNDVKIRLSTYRGEKWWKDWREKRDYQEPIGRRTADLMFWVLTFLWPAFAVFLGVLWLTSH